MVKLYSKESINDVITRIENGAVCKIDIDTTGGIIIEDADSQLSEKVLPYIKKETGKRIEALNIIKDFEEHMEDDTVTNFMFHYDSTCYDVYLSYTVQFDDHKKNKAEKIEVNPVKPDNIDEIDFLENLKETFKDNDPKTGLFLKSVGNGKNRKYQEQTVIQLIDMIKYYIKITKEKE